MIIEALFLTEIFTRCFEDDLIHWISGCFSISKNEREPFLYKRLGDKFDSLFR